MAEGGAAKAAGDYMMESSDADRLRVTTHHLRKQSCKRVKEGDKLELEESDRSDLPEPLGDYWEPVTAMDPTGTWLARAEQWEKDGRREVALWETSHPLTEKWRAPWPRDISNIDPPSLAVSPSGRVTLHDGDRGVSVLLSALGEEEKRWPHGGRLISVAGGSHYYAVARDEAYEVQVRDEEGQETTLREGWRGGGLSVCVSRSGRVIVLYVDPPSLTIFRGGAAERRVPLNYLPWWWGAVCCDSSGRIYVLEGDGRVGGKSIHVHSTDGEHLQEIRCPGLREDEVIKSIACHEQAGDVTLRMVTDRFSLLRVKVKPQPTVPQPTVPQPKVPQPTLPQPTVPQRTVQQSLSAKVQHQLPGTSGSATDDKRTFHKLSTQGTSGMLCDGNLSIMYGASQGLGTEEVVIGLSENSADLPELPAGQRRLTPVLICEPHNAVLSSSLSINLPIPPHTGAITVLYSPASDTQQQQQDGCEWRPVDDVCYYIHEDSISLVVTHFCMYCIVEDTLRPSHPCKCCTVEGTPQPQTSLRQHLAGLFLCCTSSMKKALKDTLPSPQPSLHDRIISVFLRNKWLKKKACVEVTLQWSESRDAAPVAPLRGKLVKQKTFPLINTRPITITMQPADGWIAHQELEEVIYYRELIESDSLTFDLFGDAATQEVVEFEVLLSQCHGYQRKLYVCESYEELIGESPCRNRAVQEDVVPKSKLSKTPDDKNNSPSTPQFANVSHDQVTASCSQHPGRTQQRNPQTPTSSLKCQDDTNQITPCTEIARGNGTSPMTAVSQVHTVVPGNLPEQQQAVSVDAVSDESVPDNYGSINFGKPVPEPAPRSPEIECADPESSPSAPAEDGPSADASTRDAQGHVSDSMEPSLEDDEAHVPGAGSETAGNMALERFTSARQDLVPALANLPPGHGPIQVNVVNNYYSQEASSQLPVGSGRSWLISYKKCAKVAQYLDLKDHDWKMLTSKLDFDEAIDDVEMQAKNNRDSPTMRMLREWMQKNRKKGAETLERLLKQALTALRRVDIVDEMDDLDSVHVDEMDETDEMGSSENE